MKFVTIKGMGAGLAALTAFAYTASAQLTTYVDATHGAGGNTTMTDGSVWEPTTDAENTGGWNNRPFGNDGTIYENAGTNVADDAHRLLTTVSGLNENTYDVYVYFWSSNDGADGTHTWPIRASLTDEAELPLFEPTTDGVVQFYDGADATIMSSDLDGGNPFDSDVMVAEGNRRLFQAHLGEITGTGYNFFIDDLPKTSTGGGLDRTWYDGVGHSVIPEPSTYALFAGFGVFAFIVIRRRFRR